MRITESTPSSVVVDLQFLEPFRATTVTTFTVVPSVPTTSATTDVPGR